MSASGVRRAGSLAARYARHGPPLEVIELVEVDVGEPSAGEVVVEVEAAPVHVADLLYMEGRLPIAPPAPATAGIEGVGRVVAVGAGVVDRRPGQRVLLPRRSGTFAQRMRLAADRTLPAPDHGDAAQLCLVPINAPTSYLLATGVVALQRGEWLVQNGANSSCGRFLVGIARELGLRTVNLVRREASIEELLALGGDVALLDGPDLAVRVAAATGGAPIRLAVDCVAGEATDRLGRCLATHGTIACYGRMSGEPCRIDPELLYLQDLRLRGFFTPHYEAALSRGEWQDMMQRLAGWVADGRLQAKIAARYPLVAIRDALQHEMLSGAARDGKVIVEPNR
jgi:NADPH:quinone reductase-like Zn-dependent oxidoreductase